MTRVDGIDRGTLAVFDVLGRDLIFLMLAGALATFFSPPVLDKKKSSVCCVGMVVVGRAGAEKVEMGAVVLPGVFQS